MAITPITLELTRGTSRDFPLQARFADNTVPSAVFASSDALACRVWAGDGLPVLLTPLTTWVDASLAKFLVRFVDSDTQATAPSLYRIQVTATRSGRTGILLDGYLQLSDAPGSATLADLVTQDYLAAALAAQGQTGSGLTDAQQQVLPQLAAAASRLIRIHCNRWFNRRPSADATLPWYDGCYTPDYPSRQFCLRQFPVNRVKRVRATPTTVLTVVNTDTSTNQAATASLNTTTVWDIDDVPPAVSGLSLWRVASGTETTTPTLSFATYKTLSSLAAAVNGLGNGWSATVESNFGAWPTADFSPVQGALPALGPVGSGAEFTIHTTDVPFQLDARAGILTLGSAGSNDPFGSPRFGAYLATDPGDLSVSGGIGGVRVVYDAGWDTVPEDVQQAAIETVRDMFNLLNLDQRLVGESNSAYSYTVAQGAMANYALPRSVVGKLAYYRNARA
jgi:hypothetical protein